MIQNDGKQLERETLSERIHRTVVGEAFSLDNRDLSYYRDKYLAMVITYLVLIGMGRVEQVLRVAASSKILLTAFPWVAAAVVCLFLTSRKSFVLTVSGGFLGIRLFVGFLQSGQVLFLLAALIAAAALGWVFVSADKTKWPNVKEYSVLEVAIDVIALIAFLFLLTKIP